MNVLITGGAGYIGSVLSRKLIESGHRVTIYDRFDYGKESVEELSVKLIRGDVLNTLDLSKAVKGQDGVIHLAAIVGDPSGKLIPDETLATNYFGARNIVEMSKYFGVKKFVLASTCSIYGFRDGRCSEETKPNPLSLYAETKALTEKAIMSEPGVNSTILRLGTVYGLSPRMRFDLVANLLTAKALWDNEITVYGEGKQYRPFIHVKDVARAFELALNKDMKGIYNVGSDEQNHNVEELAKIIKSEVSDSKVTYITDKEDERSYFANFDKIRALGFRPTKNLKDAVREIKRVKESGVLKDYRENKYSNFKSLKAKLAKNAE